MFRFARTSSARAVAASANVAGPVARAAVAGARVATTGTQTSAVASRAALVAARSVTTTAERTTASTWGYTAAAVGGVAAMVAAAATSTVVAGSVDWAKVRADLEEALEAGDYDDGLYGPVFVRLGWHASGTYSMHDGSGGSKGASMRFAPESEHGANAGLHVAREVLEAVKAKHPDVSYADLWILASVVAIKEMGGPDIPFHPGRTDDADNFGCTPDGRLPDAARGADHLRAIFYRMGFSDREIVALSGAHCLGRCHTDRSGYKGPWTFSPTSFTNDYFKLLLSEKWSKKKWNGPEQYEDKSGELMMLPTDVCLLDDADFRVWVEKYAADQDAWFADFALAFQKLTEAGSGVGFGASGVCPVIGSGNGAKKCPHTGGKSVGGCPHMNKGAASAKTGKWW